MFPATTHASKDVTKASRDAQERGRREEKEKERNREGEKGRGEKGRWSQLRTIVQGHSKERKGDPEYYIQESPRKQREKGGGLSSHRFQ